MGCNGESMECTECVNNGIKCWCVHAQKGGVKSEKRGQERRVRRWKRGEKKTNKDDKKDLYPDKQLTVVPSRLNTHSNEVELLGTLHPQTLCDKEQEPSENTNQSHTVLLGLCEYVKDQWVHKPREVSKGSEESSGG